MSKKKTNVADPEVLDSEAPVATEEEAPSFTDKELGIVAPAGAEMTPALREVLYNTLDLSFCQDQAEAARLTDEGTLRNLAAQYKSVYPGTWREMLLSYLKARQRDPSLLTSSEAMSRGLLRSSERQIAYLEARVLEVCLNKDPKVRIRRLEAAIYAVAQEAAKGT